MKTMASVGFSATRRDVNAQKKRGFAVYAKVCVLDLTKNLGTLDAKEKLISFFPSHGYAPFSFDSKICSNHAEK